MAKMCMKFNFIPIRTYLCGVCHIYIVVALTTLDPMSLGTIFVLEFVFRYIGDALEACLTYKEGVITMCLLEPSSDDHELLSSTSPMLSR